MTYLYKRAQLVVFSLHRRFHVRSVIICVLMLYLDPKASLPFVSQESNTDLKFEDIRDLTLLSDNVRDGIRSCGIA